MSNQANILITGATGSIGSALTRILSAQGVPFRAMVREKSKAKELSALPGATVTEGDFNNPESLKMALQGIDRAFLLTNSSELAETQQLAFVAAAKQAGVKHIVKLSQLAADINSPVRFLRYHAVVEQKIRETGISWTFLRPNLFMQGLLGFRDPIIAKGMFFAAAGDARISLVDVRDIAAVAAAALTEDGHEGKIYHLTGPEVMTHQEIAHSFSEGLNREIQFVDVSEDVMKDAVIKAGFPQWQAEGLIEDYAHYRRNEADLLSSDIATVTGRSPHSFRDFLQDYAFLFKAS